MDFNGSRDVLDSSLLSCSPSCFHSLKPSQPVSLRVSHRTRRCPSPWPGRPRASGNQAIVALLRCGREAPERSGPGVCFSCIWAAAASCAHGWSAGLGRRKRGLEGTPVGRCWCRGWPSSSSSTMSSWILQILRLALSRTFWIYELVLGSIFYFVLWILSLRRSEIKCHCFARRLATSSLPQLRKGGCLNFPE